MPVSRILLAAAFAVSLSPALTTVASAAQADCGWVRENGKLVFLGTCPHEVGDTGGPSQDAPAASTPPPG